MLLDKLNNSAAFRAGMEETRGKTIGEFSDQEWDKLLEKVDRVIDDYKEDLKEREEEARKEQKEKTEPEMLSRRKTEELIREQNVMQGGALQSLRFQRINDGMDSSETEAVEKTDTEKTGAGEAAMERILGERRQIPYSVLADENGIIEYNGVVFVGDETSNSLCLGDMTDYDNILTIPLSDGGYLKVNMDNVDDLSKAITMFSPQDINRIMRAIAQYNKLKQIQQQIEDETSGLEVLKKSEDIGFYA